ncbi:hydrogenase maturation nickel metallochaperone HypA/HybF [Chitinophaga sancti]|uniref:Hydrogenase maturation factor HypA n=1 Tax=Chitinophaga sancti TaxID=1004 RepID=A0A1K1S6C4_9BACT|nr:hydrogenase maturation nickel metallochaperone HypA [Chitinophaga sancti]WQD62244.1 hydrogenase maturation nickel metallochaperone HypA [Chitinophaga sancti]WQG92187.1 hydrogenase maturation nickel metallochaperone HypA [Chitinophaga sancti]SFW79762.1 hydrogenase nickel incorporation protein HypA/HybF [Chitinophaga sancti]
MHELSIVMGIIDVVTEYAKGAPVKEVTLDIGCLTTIEMFAFDMAWKQAIKGTLLEKATLDINRIAGSAVCLECGNEFAITEVYDACTGCGSHLIHIAKGKELKVRSLIIF